MALPILDKYFHPLHHGPAKKEPLRAVTLVQTEPKESFVASSHEEFKPVSAQQMRSLVLDKDKAILQAYRPEIQSGQAYAVRAQDGQLHMVTHHPAADTFMQFDKYFRGGESAIDSCQFLRGEGKGALKSADGLYQTVRHPIAAGQSLKKAVIGSGPALVDFSRNSQGITIHAAGDSLKGLADADPLKAGMHWGSTLFGIGMAAMPFPSGRYLMKGLEAGAEARPVLEGLPKLESRAYLTEIAKPYNTVDALLEIKKLKGNSALEVVRTEEQAREIGEAWVGEGARMSEKPLRLVSEDGLRVYRFPAPKKSTMAITSKQANLEECMINEQKLKIPVKNVHIDIVDH